MQLFLILVSVINYYHINRLHLFWKSFEWFCLQISSDAKYLFSSCPEYCDRGIIVDIVYYFQIWNEKEHDIIISRVISCHMPTIYIERPYICTALIIFTSINFGVISLLSWRTKCYLGWHFQVSLLHCLRWNKCCSMRTKSPYYQKKTCLRSFIVWYGVYGGCSSCLSIKLCVILICAMRNRDIFNLSFLDSLKTGFICSSRRFYQ